MPQAELEGIVEADGVMKQVVEDVKNMISYLPLELFEFEDPYTPQEWVLMGLGPPNDAGEPSSYTIGRTPQFNVKLQAFEWKKCYVLSYDEEERGFLVKMVESGAMKMVKRLNLRFIAPKYEPEKVRAAGRLTAGCVSCLCWTSCASIVCSTVVRNQSARVCRVLGGTQTNPESCAWTTMITILCGNM